MAIRSPALNVLTMQNLDFDFEKCCVVSLSPINVYACLVCGKYFQVSLHGQCQRCPQHLSKHRDFIYQCFCRAEDLTQMHSRILWKPIIICL